MRWKFLFVFYLKKMLKSKLYAGASVLFFVLLIARLILFFSDDMQSNMEYSGQPPHEVFMLVQMISIFYIVFSIFSIQRSFFMAFSPFFVDGYRIMLEKMSAMLAAHMLCQGFMMMAYHVFSLVYFFIST